MRAVDLLDDPDRRSYAAMPEMDALTEAGALQEAALVDVCVDAVTCSVSLLFDLRGALQLREGSVAVLIARGVERFEWRPCPGERGRVWHAVTASIPDNSAGRFRLRLGFVSSKELVVEAAAGEFYVGDMPGMDGAPPDFVDDDIATIRAGMPSWSAPFEPGWATFLDPSDLV